MSSALLQLGLMTHPIKNNTPPPLHHCPAPNRGKARHRHICVLFFLFSDSSLFLLAAYLWLPLARLLLLLLLLLLLTPSPLRHFSHAINLPPTHLPSLLHCTALPCIRTFFRCCCANYKIVCFQMNRQLFFFFFFNCRWQGSGNWIEFLTVFTVVGSIRRSRRNETKGVVSCL